MPSHLTEQGPRLSATTVEEYRLQHLHRWLTAGGSSGALAGTAFFIPYGIVLTLLKWAAVIFAPYMLWRLAQSKRFGWIAAFMFVVGLPLGFSMITQPQGVGGFIISVVPLFTFYSYTWLLRHTVAEWLEELRWQREDYDGHLLLFM